MKNTLKKWLAIVLVGVMAFALTACGGESAQSAEANKDAAAETTETTETGSEEAGSEDTGSKELETIRLAVMTGDVTAWTAAVGEEKGIYEKYGIKLEVTEFPMGINTLDAVSTEQADIGFVADFAGINRLGNTSGEPNFKIFARLAEVVDYRIYAKDDIKSIEDLKGKNVGVILGTIYEYLNSVALQSVGLTPDDVQIQSYSANTDGLAGMASGDLDAMWSGGMASAKLDKMEGVSLLKTQEELGAVSSWIYMGNTKFLEEKNDLVKRYLEATQEVYDVMEKDLNGAAEIVEAKTTMPKDDFLELIANYKLGIDFGDSALETLDKVNEWARTNNFFTKEYDPRTYIDAKAVTELYPDRVSDQLKK